MLLKIAEKMVDGCFAVIPRAKPPIKNIDEARIIAHRGAHDHSKGVIENTLEAFERARQAGCWGLEFDIHVTADDVLVVNHDPTLSRLWGHDVAISTLSFSELRALEPGVPTLAEVVAEYGNMHLFIELKSPLHNEQVLVTALQELTAGKDFHLLALDAGILNFITQFPREALLLVAVHNNVRHFCELSIKEGFGGVMGSYLLLTNKKIELLKSASQNSGVGFVNSKNALYRELNRGIHWIFTNKAVKVCHYLQLLKDGV